MCYVKGFLMMLLGVIPYTIITILDLITCAFAVITKGVRYIWIKVLRLLWDAEYEHIVKTAINWQVNYAYKYIVDKLYPAEEDEES